MSEMPPPPEPWDSSGVRTLAVGTGLWALAFVALLPFYGRLADDGHLWWMWTCVAGFGMGLLGLEVCRRRVARESAGPAAGPAAESPDIR